MKLKPLEATRHHYPTKLLVLLPITTDLLCTLHYETPCTTPFNVHTLDNSKRAWNFSSKIIFNNSALNVARIGNGKKIKLFIYQIFCENFGL